MPNGQETATIASHLRIDPDLDAALKDLPLTPGQEARVREIVNEEVRRVVRGYLDTAVDSAAAALKPVVAGLVTATVDAYPVALADDAGEGSD